MKARREVSSLSSNRLEDDAARRRGRGQGTGQRGAITVGWCREDGASGRRAAWGQPNSRSRVCPPQGRPRFRHQPQAQESSGYLPFRPAGYKCGVPIDSPKFDNCLEQLAELRKVLYLMVTILLQQKTQIRTCLRKQHIG